MSNPGEKGRKAEQHFPNQISFRPDTPSKKEFGIYKFKINRQLMKAKKKYYLIFICFISIAITNISITTSSNSNFNIVLNNLEAIASSGEGSGPSLKEFSCFTGETGNPKDIYLPIEKYCGNCKSARVGLRTGTGHCKSFE